MHFTNIKQNTDEFITDLWINLGGLYHIAEYKITYEKFKKLKYIFSSYKNQTLHWELEHTYYIQEFKLHSHGHYGNYYIVRKKDTYNSFVVCLGIIKSNQELNTIPLSLFLSELI